jgi:hypothetical protein
VKTTKVRCDPLLSFFDPELSVCEIPESGAGTPETRNC